MISYGNDYESKIISNEIGMSNSMSPVRGSTEKTPPMPMTDMQVMPEMASMAGKEMMLKKVMGYDFAALDILLYMDTHPNDMSAFNIYKDVVAKAKAARNDYEAKFGPLTQYDAAQDAGNKWSDGPWPWEKQGG